MKYSSYYAFEQWLITLEKTTFPKAVFLQIGDDFERNEAIFCFIAQYRKLAGEEIVVKRLQADISAETLASDLMDDLFNTTPVCVRIDQLEEFKEGNLSVISEYLTRGAAVGRGRESTLLLSGGVSVDLQNMFSGQKLVVIEIPDCKPWEKQGRAQEWIMSYLARHGKRIQPKAATELAKEFAGDRFMLKSELDKLLTYTAEKPEITSLDCAQICSVVENGSLWDLMPAIFERNLSLSMEIVHSLQGSEMHVLQIIRYFRNQVHQALVMANLASTGKSVADSMAYFPQLRHQKAFEKQFGLAVRYGQEALQRALIIVDQLEVDLKNSSKDEEIALEMVVVTLIRC